jgi:hypothetical protein
MQQVQPEIDTSCSTDLTFATKLNHVVRYRRQPPTPSSRHGVVDQPGILLDQDGTLLNAETLTANAPGESLAGRLATRASAVTLLVDSDLQVSHTSSAVIKRAAPQR